MTSTAVVPRYEAPEIDAVDALLSEVTFNADGLITAIAQQHDSGEILMLAWMNADALRETLLTGRVCYWSRSRKGLWRKGESSGQTQTVVDVRLDCDGDAVLVLVHQDGVACHTGRRNCFFRAIRDGAVVSVTEPLVSEETLYGR